MTTPHHADQPPLHQQTEESFRQGEELHRNLLDYMLEGCQILGFDWRYIYLNRSAEIHNERPNSELIGQRYMDVWPGIEQTAVFTRIRQTLEEQVSHRFENEFIYPDGTIGWFNLNIQPVPEGVFISSIDITERKKAEKALRESEEKYRLISDNSDDWIYWIAPNGSLNYVSPACLRVTGYSPKEFADHPELNNEIVLDADKEKVRQHTKISKQVDTPHQLEFRIVTKDGNIRWISHSCSPLLGSKGEYLGQRGTNRNITERKLQEEKLFESEFRFNKLWENGPFGMVMADKDFCFKKANSTFCTILGYNETELQQFTFKDVSHPDDLAKDLPNIRKLMNQEISVYETEKRYIRKDGQVIWGSLTVTATYDSEGDFLYNLGIIVDITRRKLAEEELRKSKKLLSETEAMGKVGGWEFNIDTMLQTWTDEVYRIHEVDPGFNPNVDAGINFYSPGSRPILEKAVQKILESGEPFDLELEIITAKGNLRKVHSIGKADFENRRVYGFFQDITERKRSEEKISELNERISTATRASQVGIWDWDVKNDLLTWDDQMYVIYGIQKDEFTSAYEAWVNGLHPADKEFGTLQTQMALMGEKEYDTEFRVVWPDGTIRHCKAKGEVFRDEKGVPIRMVGINYDITEQKKIDQKIREKDQEFRKLSANVPDLLFQFTRRPDGNYCVPIASDGIRNIFGCNPEDVLEDFGPIGRVIYPEDAERVIRDIEYSAEHLTYFTCEFRVQIPGREIQWIYSRSTPERLPDGSITWYGFNVDITHKKLAEEAIRYNEALLREVGRLAMVGGWEYNPLTGLSNWTKQVAIIHDLDPETPASVSMSINFYTEQSRPVIEKAFREVVELAIPYDLELEIITAKGNPKWIRTIGHPVVENGKVILVHGSFQDVTERKRAENEIIKLNETLEMRVEERTIQLREAIQELEAFSYSVSHDLRAPLRHINGFVDLLHEKYFEQLPEKGKHYLTVITEASNQMGKLIDDLLQFSRTGRQEMQHMKLDMNILLQEVVHFFKAETETRNIDWNIASMPKIMGDFALLRMVWFNLVSNAIKFTREKDKALIEIGFFEEKKEFIFFIRDNGAGFDMRFVHKLFGVFQRLHTKQQFEGTGIGLANVQRIILRHGGRVWAESELNKGATFYFTIPKVEENPK